MQPFGRVSAGSNYCFSSFVIVLTPPTSVTVTATLSPGFTALNTSPSCTLIASPAGIGADSTALGLLDRNLAGRFIDLADCAGDALLGNCALASEEEKHRTAKNAFCIFHVRLPTFDSCG